MKKSYKAYTPVIITLMALGAALVLVTPFFDMRLFYVSATLSLLTFAYVLFALRRISRADRSNIELVETSVTFADEAAFTDFPIPVISVFEGEIIWYNDLCSAHVLGGRDVRGERAEDIFPGLDTDTTSDYGGVNLQLGDRLYTAYVSVTTRQSRRMSVVYLTEDTQLKFYAGEYQQSRPSVAIVMVDNYEELMQDYKDGERAQLMSGIESAIEGHITKNSGFMLRIERDKFVAVIEERGIQGIIQSKFALLDEVRALRMQDKMSATLSIGIGHDAESLSDSIAMARQALDMCLGRGGDQVAIRNKNGYEFYGGISKGVEKRTKVKTRIIATALSELIESSGNVLLMGHRYADLDSLGSCVGMMRAVKAMGKPCAICIHPSENLVKPLIDRLFAGGMTAADFVDAESAMSLVNEHTLLVVLDTHVPHVLESEKLYRACKNVVVIDHHRKLVNYIDNAVIFYHEPFASSTAEMVSEILQYLPVNPRLSKLDAEAMLSGIMLDTKSFSLRTGVRTFEAAAYLRRLGADTIEVRKLFASSMDSYQKKAKLVASAEIYRSCAVACADEEAAGIKIVAPQAADELMGISGVDASFVIFTWDGVVNVSARSMGAINVQVVMETLGGGGHHTMAAAQFRDETVAHVKERTIEAIDAYYKALNTQH